MTPLDICSQRLVNQHLTRQSLEKASDIVGLLGAVQAQDYSGAKWALAQRTRGATDSVVEKEINEGAILRTHVLRPTWHFVAPADIRWMLALTGLRVKAVLAYYDRELGIDDAVLRRSRTVFTKALLDGTQLTRSELAQALTRARIRADGTQRLARLVMHAELDGLICSGARRGKQFTYALLEDRVPKAKELERDAALSELATRYFTTRGPATVRDFAWWSGLSITDAKRGVQAAEAGFEHVVIAGRQYWFPHAGRSTKRKSLVARLLPAYDEYFIGLKDRTAMQAKLKSSGVEPKVDFIFSRALTVDGQIVGGWQHTFKGKSVLVELKPHTRLGEEEHRAVAREVDRFAAFLELSAGLTIVEARA
jgi:hypothetical protein